MEVGSPGGGSDDREFGSFGRRDELRLKVPSVDAQRTVDDVLDDLRFDDIVDRADAAISYWLSIREAAYRRERLTVAVHFRQVRLTTFAAFQTISEFSAEPREIARAT